MRELSSGTALLAHLLLALNFSVGLFAGHVVLLVACITWGIQKVLFKIKEREELRDLVAKQATRIAELEPQAARVPQLEQQVADLVARVAQLENQKTQRPPE